MNEKEIRAKISKLEEQKDKIESQIEDLEEQLPQKVQTRGDPVVRFH